MSWGKYRKVQTFFCSNRKRSDEIDKDGNGKVATISYIIQFIDSARFMTSLLSNAVDNLAEVIPKIKWKYCDCFHEYESVKDNLIKHKCLSCNKDYLNKLDQKLKKDLRTHLSFLIIMSINLFCY